MESSRPVFFTMNPPGSRISKVDVRPLFYKNMSTNYEFANFVGWTRKEWVFLGSNVSCARFQIHGNGECSNSAIPAMTMRKWSRHSDFCNGRLTSTSRKTRKILEEKNERVKMEWNIVRPCFINEIGRKLRKFVVRSRSFIHSTKRSWNLKKKSYNRTHRFTINNNVRIFQHLSFFFKLFSQFLTKRLVSSCG